MAYVYFKDQKDAETVLSYANLRYVNNKQMFIKYASNFLDITDFRTRVELGVEIEDPLVELRMFQKQLNNLKQLESKSLANNAQEEEKIQYLKMRARKLEFSLGLTSTPILLENIKTKNDLL